MIVALVERADGTGILSNSDIDLISAEKRTDVSKSLFGQDADGDFGVADRRKWIEDSFGTFYGDANLDKIVGFADFTSLSTHFNMPGGISTEMASFSFQTRLR